MREELLRWKPQEKGLDQLLVEELNHAVRVRTASRKMKLLVLSEKGERLISMPGSFMILKEVQQAHVEGQWPSNHFRQVGSPEPVVLFYLSGEPKPFF